MRAADEEKWLLWARKAVVLLKAADVPTMREAGRMADSEKAELAALGNVRASTLQARVRPWSSSSGCAGGRARPGRRTSLTSLTSWRSVSARPRLVLSRSPSGRLWSWLEARSGVKEDEKLGNRDLVKRMFDKAVANGTELLEDPGSRLRWQWSWSRPC